MRKKFELLTGPRGTYLDWPERGIAQDYPFFTGPRPSFSYRRVQSDNREFHIIACKEARWGFIRGSCCSRCKYGIGSYGLRIRRGFSLGSSLCFCFGRSGCQILEPGRRVGLIGRRQGGGIYNWTLERRIGLIGWWWTEPDCADHERGNGASSLHSF